MSARIAAARAKLMSRPNDERRLDGGDPALAEAVLPPLDPTLGFTVESDFADPFADGNEGGFELVGGRELGSPGNGTSSPDAVGRLWASFASSDTAKTALGQISS